MSKRTPENFLKQVFGRKVTVKLHSGSEYTGVLASMDALMNLVLEQASEFEHNEQVNSFDRVLLRGNNGTYIIFSFIYEATAQRGLTFFTYLHMNFYLQIYTQKCLHTKILGLTYIKRFSLQPR
jgi:small nuclear ribonucleoprotein (snRNP)-like protein